MLGLGNTLSGGIVPAGAAASSFDNTYSLAFDGSDDRLIIGDVTILDGDNTFTISTWVKFASLPTAGNKFVIVSKDEAYELYIRTSTVDSVVVPWLYLRLNNGATNNTGTLSISADTWYHIAATHKSDGTDIYLDGSAVGTGLGSQATINDTSESLGIGARANGGYPVPGSIDEVSIFDAALDASAIAAIYNSGTPTDLSGESNLVGYWRMGDGATYPTIPDDSSNSNDGTMTGMTSGDLVEDVP